MKDCKIVGSNTLDEYRKKNWVSLEAMNRCFGVTRTMMLNWLETGKIPEDRYAIFEYQGGRYYFFDALNFPDDLKDELLARTEKLRAEARRCAYVEAYRVLGRKYPNVDGPLEPENESKRIEQFRDEILTISAMLAEAKNRLETLLSGGIYNPAMLTVLGKRVADYPLSPRLYNCLRAADIYTIADLVSYSRAELMSFRNFGRKSLNEADLFIERLGLSFGMDVTKYGYQRPAFCKALRGDN